MLKPILKVAALVATIATATAPAVASTSRVNQAVADIQVDFRPCLFFNLSGVSEADPAVPG